MSNYMVNGGYPPVNIPKKRLNMAIEIIDLPGKHGDSSIVVLVYQRVADSGWG